MAVALTGSGAFAISAAIVLLIKNRDHKWFVRDLVGDAARARGQAAAAARPWTASGWRADAWLRERPLWLVMLLSMLTVLAGVIGLLIHEAA